MDLLHALAANFSSLSNRRGRAGLQNHSQSIRQKGGEGRCLDKGRVNHSRAGHLVRMACEGEGGRGRRFTKHVHIPNPNPLNLVQKSFQPLDVLGNPWDGMLHHVLTIVPRRERVQ